MPWQGTELWLAAFADDGTLIALALRGRRRVESLCQPVWAPDGRLYVVSDRSGFWNLYRLDGERPGAGVSDGGRVRPAAMGVRAVVVRLRRPHEIVATCRENAISRLLRIDVRSGAATPISTPFEDIAELRVGDGVVSSRPARRRTTACIATISLADGAVSVLARSADDLPDAAMLSVPRAISFPSADGRTAHAFHYPPRNAGFALPGRRAAAADRDQPRRPDRDGHQHAQARDAVLDQPRLRRAGRQLRRLAPASAARTGSGSAASGASSTWRTASPARATSSTQGLADGERLAIRGGSAGGYTTLAALAFHDVFKAGASYYGVGDLRALDADTPQVRVALHHRPARAHARARTPVRERSPIHSADRLSCPVIFFQGLDDKVVPPAGGEEGEQAGDLFRRAGAAHRDVRFDVGALLRIVLPGGIDRRDDGTRRHLVHANAAAGIFECQGARDVADGALAGGISQEARLRNHARAPSWC
jgi:hypothetical protein